MAEGFLAEGTTPGSYALNDLSGIDLVRGQAIKLFLGGEWIAGHVAYSSGYVDPTRGADGNVFLQSRGMYAIADDEPENSVTEASEESFPASDPPAWSAAVNTANQRAHLLNGPYFVADVDGSICGLCTGMKVRV